MSPFSGDMVAARDNRPVDHESAADSGAEDHAEHATRACARAVDGFGQRKTIGVIFDLHGAREQTRKIGVEGFPVHDGGI